jgi:hypothetical protein
MIEGAHRLLIILEGDDLPTHDVLVIHLHKIFLALFGNRRRGRRLDELRVIGPGEAGESES